jgi:CHASE3 domain sensor protein
MDDQHRQELLRSSAAYATAKLAFANAIVIAQRGGEADEESARITRYTVPRRAPLMRSVVGHVPGRYRPRSIPATSRRT